MENRTKLHELLCNTLGSRNVYFQPPENLKMKYPAIVYELDDTFKKYANNSTYIHMLRYNLTYIYHDPDDPTIIKLDSLPFCDLSRTQISDHLNHAYYTIYY